MNGPADLNLTDVKRALIECAARVGLRLIEEEQDASPADVGHPDKHISSAYGRGTETPSSLTVALAWINARKCRDSVLGPDLFADPAWDMLLDLYVNHIRDRPVSITSLCLASEVPTTTALRWITVLETSALIMRTPDPNDRRRSYVHLTPLGIQRMEKVFARASDSDNRLGLGRLRAFD